MKTLIRASVVILALTGSAAFTQANIHDSKIVKAPVNSRPIPFCAPNDPSACGMP